MCDEASQLISTGVDQTLPFMKRVRLRLHLFFCRRCLIFRVFVIGLQREAAEIQAADLSHFPALSEHVKEDIVRRINNRVRSNRDGEGKN